MIWKAWINAPAELIAVVALIGELGELGLEYAFQQIQQGFRFGWSGGKDETGFAFVDDSNGVHTESCQFGDLLGVAVSKYDIPWFQVDVVDLPLDGKYLQFSTGSGIGP